ncbi:MAG TPA: type II toxin-antitoxin system PemK/MazF family toxin [Allosphingosinicella sp.]|nr:type II toxin-antitoxin system PemK/MazF family toxin [Allosphingosinicella sp.]
MRRSKPSGPRNPRNARASSGGSWKTPEPADVISYSYLWAREAAAEEESGRKDRPVVVVVARIEEAAGTLVLVAPVTHTAPEKATDAVEIPRNVKKQLGLDGDRSWIVVTELNRFIWPGPDIRLAPETGTPFYDALPDWLFERVRNGVLRHSGQGRLKVTKRTI